MPTRVKLHLGSSCPSKIEVGDDEFLPIPYRLREKLTERINNTTPTAAGDLWQTINLLLTVELVARVVFPFEEHIGINEVTAPLKTDVPRCVDPRIHVIRVRCNEDIYAALIERRTGERHIVFPADKTAEWPPRALHR